MISFLCYDACMKFLWINVYKLELFIIYDDNEERANKLFSSTYNKCWFCIIFHSCDISPCWCFSELNKFFLLIISRVFNQRNWVKFKFHVSTPQLVILLIFFLWFNNFYFITTIKYLKYQWNFFEIVVEITRIEALSLYIYILHVIRYEWECDFHWI
jgi:hypothetical protein